MLLGLFFIAVGMTVDVGVLPERPLLVASLALGFLALKSAVLYVLGRYFGIARGQQVLFAFLLAQGGEFAFVVLDAAAAARVLTAPTASLLVLVVQQFRNHNFKTLHAVYPHYQDQHQMISLAKQGRQELEDMFARDAAALPAEAGDNSAADQ